MNAAMTTLSRLKLIWPARLMTNKYRLKLVTSRQCEGLKDDTRIRSSGITRYAVHA